MIYNIAIFDDISNSVGVALRSFFGHLVALIYNLIEYLYKLFDYISRAEILDNEFIQSFYSKVGLILGLFMLFKLVFSLVNSLISPDKLDDKKNGAVAIIKRSIISIVLLGITPTLFDEAFEIQRLLVGNSTGDNVLYKLISNSPTTAETEIGHTLATDLYLSFYTDYETPHLNNGTIDTIYDTDDEYYDRFKNDNFENLEFNLREGNISFGDTVDYLAIKNSENKYVIEFNWLVLLIVGGVVAWMMAMYCIQAATRVVQLAYLQLIAPVPIISYISDPEGSFKRWIKQCTSTYLDLFFRLAIIYFIMTLVKDVLEQFDKAGGIIFESTGIPTGEHFTLGLVKVLIILGLLLFAKRAPELLKELFPNLGKGPFSYSLNPKKTLFEPLKELYNNTPIGWAPKAMGWAGKKTLGYVDRKIHNVPRPRGKVGQYFDKLMPERAKDIAANRQAKIDERLRETKDARGKNIYDNCTYIDENGERKFNPYKAFTGNGANDYIKSYENVKKSKKQMKEAETLVGEIDKELTAAYNIVDPEKRERAIELAKKRRDAAVKNYGAYEAQYKLAQEKHDSMRKQSKYSKFATIEDDYKFYTDRHPEFIDIPERGPEITEEPPQHSPLLQEQFSSQSDVGGEVEIIIPDISPKQSSRFEEEKQQQVHEAVQQEIVETTTQVSQAINDNTSLDETKKKTAETLQQRLAELISYKEQIRDQKDKAEIEHDIQMVKDELDKLLK